MAKPQLPHSIDAAPLLAWSARLTEEVLVLLLENEIAQFLQLQRHRYPRQSPYLRNGHSQMRILDSSLGPLQLRQPRLVARGDMRPRPPAFASDILPAYQRSFDLDADHLPGIYAAALLDGRIESLVASLLPRGTRLPSFASDDKLATGWRAIQTRTLAAGRPPSPPSRLWAAAIGLPPPVLSAEPDALLILGLAETETNTPMTLCLQRGHQQSSQHWQACLRRVLQLLPVGGRQLLSQLECQQPQAESAADELLHSGDTAARRPRNGQLKGERRRG